MDLSYCNRSLPLIQKIKELPDFDGIFNVHLLMNQFIVKYLF